ncbi:MAG: 1-hydroxycarotenoid 3,4-desaturase CrtD [Flavobacteriaceae bacterium]
MKKKGIVIGAGIAGIATAIRLAHKGYAVEVFEANPYPGGKLSAFSLGDYRFDAGPSLFTMPHFVDELFALCGENPRDHFNYRKKEIACQYFWEDGTRLTAYSDQEKFLQEIEDKLGVATTVVEAYLAKAKKKYDLTADLFLHQSLHQWKTYASKTTLKALMNLGSMEIGHSLDKVNQQQLKEPHLVQLFNRYATYNGSSPYKTPGIMSLIQHLESHYGTFLPKGGMVEISQSLFALAQRQGVVFHLGKKVAQILVENKRAVGVKVDGKNLFADWVVSNMDVHPTYKKLLPETKMPANVRREERSSSAVIFYWGIEKSFPELDLHNILFSENYPEEFKAIFEDKQLYADPTIYINITAKDEEKDAPQGAENWFVMINSPADHGQDWAKEIPKLRANVLEKIQRILGTDIAPLIKEEEVMSPPEIQAKTQSHLGALYGASSNNKMAAFLRHPNFKRSIEQLYFCGGSVHPGGGIPLCLLSAKIVSDQFPAAV